MEQTQPCRLVPEVAVAGREAKCEDRRRDALDEQRDRDDAFDEPADVIKADAARLGCRGDAGRERQPPHDDQSDHRREGHDPEAAELDEGENHDLPAERPVARGVHDDVPGDRDRGDGREDRLDGRRAARAGLGDGKGQKNRPDRRGEREAGEDRLGRPEARGAKAESFEQT